MRKTVTKPMTGHQQDIIFDVIAVHAAAWARFGRAVSLVDDDVAKEEGRKITAADQAEYDDANAAEEKAFNAFLAVPLNDPIALATKGLWLRLRLRGGDNLEREEVELLIQSMIDAPARARS